MWRIGFVVVLTVSLGLAALAVAAQQVGKMCFSDGPAGVSHDGWRGPARGAARGSATGR